MTNEDHVAALTAVFDRIKIANPLGLPLDADGLTNIATIIATHPEVRIAHAHCAGDTDDQRIELWLGGMVSVPPVFTPENCYLDVSACLKF